MNQQLILWSGYLPRHVFLANIPTIDASFFFLPKYVDITFVLVYKK